MAMASGYQFLPECGGPAAIGAELEVRRGGRRPVGMADLTDSRYVPKAKRDPILESGPLVRIIPPNCGQSLAVRRVSGEVFRSRQHGPDSPGGYVPQLNLRLPRRRQSQL